jgi:protein-tyrosine phosphatase
VSPLVTDVSVEALAPGSLWVRWSVVGRVAVDLAVGPTPEAIDHVHARRVDAGTTEAVLEGLGPGRHYVSVGPAGEGGAIVAAERLVPLESAPNFRDLGGYRVAGGGRTRWGLVFRSAGLSRLSVADRVLFDRLGLRTVYDLRRDDEREREPSTHEVRAVPLSLMPGRPRPTDPDGVQFLRELYVEILDQSAHHLATLLTGLTDPEALPALFHCSAGKDRTGLTAGLLLALLGVADADILDDYQLTERHLGPIPPELHQLLVEDGWHPEAILTSGGAPRHLMAEAIDGVRGRFGSVEAYLVEAGGMEREVPDELRRLLVT